MTKQFQALPQDTEYDQEDNPENKMKYWLSPLSTPQQSEAQSQQ
jgi:hypothetical protein